MAKVKVEELYKNNDFFPVIKGTDRNLFINPLNAGIYVYDQIRRTCFN